MSKFLKRSLSIFIIKVFGTIVFIFIVISTMFRPICPPAFFRYLSNSGTFTELQTTSFIETTGFACSDSVSHNRVQVLSIPVYYSPVVRIEPATFRWLSQKLREPTPITVTTRVLLDNSEWIFGYSIKDVVQSSVKVPKFNEHLKKARGHISRNVVEITIKMKTIVRKTLMIKISKIVLIIHWNDFFFNEYCFYV